VFTAAENPAAVIAVFAAAIEGFARCVRRAWFKNRGK